MIDSNEIVKADPTARKVVLAALVVALVLGAFLIAKVLPMFRYYVQSLPPEQAVSTIRYVLALLFLAVVPAGVYFFVLGGKSARERRYPPSGLKVIKDTPVLSGDGARTRGRVIQAVAVILTLAGLAGAAYAWFAVGALMGW